MRIVGLNRFILVACTIPLLAVGAAAQHAHNPPGQQPPPDLVDAVRQATERFRDVNQTSGANYVPFLGCVAGAQEGAMGVHFVNMAFLNDLGKVLADQPEALIYEPHRGKFRLVGVEYIVPVQDWKDNNPPEIGNFPPVLNGQTFQFVDFPNRFGIPAFYELHVWAWQDNPKGTFADWNTLVSCDGAVDGEEAPWQ
jgi:hypothetical protein